MIIIIIIFECNFRYAHMQIVDIRRLKKSFVIFFQKNLNENISFFKSIKI